VIPSHVRSVHGLSYNLYDDANFNVRVSFVQRVRIRVFGARTRLQRSGGETLIQFHVIPLLSQIGLETMNLIYYTILSSE
jgi:hypothetical protein